jgi:hypothetical protein
MKTSSFRMLGLDLSLLRMLGPLSSTLDAHATTGGSDGGRNVMLWQTYNRVNNTYSYWSWYQRHDPLWAFNNSAVPGNQGTNDNNFKTFDLSTGPTPYETNGSATDHNNWYLQYTANASETVGGYFQASGNDDSSGNCLQIPDANGRNPNFGYPPNDDMTGHDAFAAWRKWEVEIKWTSSTGTGNGYIKWWNDGVLVFSYVGATDRFQGTQRSEGIGGYARNRDPKNYRYFADIYYDRQSTGAARFYLTNNATFNATGAIQEVQPYTTWTTTTVNLTCNRAALSTGTAHVHFQCPVNGNKYLGTVTLA